MAERRIKRWRKKYTVEEATKRAKKLLPVMYPQMETQLIIWDELEQMLYPVFEELGIPTEEYRYYMAWAKRKGALGLDFSAGTRTQEINLLYDEFVTRGLNPDFLDELEPIVDEWIEKTRSVAGEMIINGGFETGDGSGWELYYNYVTDEYAHTGVYSCYITASGWSRQYLRVRVDKIRSFTFWVYNPYDDRDGWVTVRAHYTDYTYDYVEFKAERQTWVRFDVLPYLTRGKTIDYIEFVNSMGCGLYLDDVSLRGA